MRCKFVLKKGIRFSEEIEKELKKSGVNIYNVIQTDPKAENPPDFIDGEIPDEPETLQKQIIEALKKLSFIAQIVILSDKELFWCKNKCDTPVTRLLLPVTVGGRTYYYQCPLCRVYQNKSKGRS